MICGSYIRSLMIAHSLLYFSLFFSSGLLLLLIHISIIALKIKKVVVCEYAFFANMGP